MSRITPTPWSVETPMDEEFAIVQSGLEAYEWQFIAVCPVGTPAEAGFPRQNAKLNAAFIVKACNSHDALVSAATKALNYIENTESELGIKLSSGVELRAALALAKS